jgi:hypothetical protein
MERKQYSENDGIQACLRVNTALVFGQGVKPDLLRLRTTSPATCVVQSMPTPSELKKLKQLYSRVYVLVDLVAPNVDLTAFEEVWRVDLDGTWNRIKRHSLKDSSAVKSPEVFCTAIGVTKFSSQPFRKMIVVPEQKYTKDEISSVDAAFKQNMDSIGLRMWKQAPISPLKCGSKFFGASYSMYNKLYADAYSETLCYVVEITEVINSTQVQGSTASAPAAAPAAAPAPAMAVARSDKAVQTDDQPAADAAVAATEPIAVVGRKRKYAKTKISPQRKRPTRSSPRKRS